MGGSSGGVSAGNWSRGLLLVTANTRPAGYCSRGDPAGQPQSYTHTGRWIRGKAGQYGWPCHQTGSHRYPATGRPVVLLHGRRAGAGGYNKLTTPIGGQFRITLPDGTRAWLNAASSLRYPTAFTAGERLVEVTGEAYFEVTQNATQPFKVKVNNESTTIIEVLGTDFNVNAYTDEPSIITTLLEGAVRVRAGNRQAALTPGQQAQVSNANNIKIVNNADLSAAVAWKEGVFYFKDADLATVLRQIGRWYNVEIVYEGAVPAQSFRGKLGRDLSLADVVETLQRSEVNCRVEGRKLIVSP